MYKAISIALSLKDVKGYLKSWYKTPEEADNWLKSLKERYTWKPSEEELTAVLVARNNVNSINADILRKLYNELKKL